MAVGKAARDNAKERITHNMKSIKWLAVLFLLNNEVVSWITLAVLAVACMVWFFKEADYESNRSRP